MKGWARPNEPARTKKITIGVSDGKVIKVDNK